MVPQRAGTRAGPYEYVSKGAGPRRKEPARVPDPTKPDCFAYGTRFAQIEFGKRSTSPSHSPCADRDDFPSRK